MRRRSSSPPHTQRFLLTSLLLVEEKLQEAKYFIGRMIRCRDPRYFGFELNAFLSSARSAVFLLRKEMARVPGWRAWWSDTETAIEADAVMRFFRDLRNYSQKEGRVRIEAWSGQITDYRRIRYRRVFLNGAITVPSELRGVEVIEACRIHLAKTASIMLRFADDYPYHACPRRALTVDGVAALNIDLGDVDEALGLPRGYTDLGSDFTVADRIHVLGREFDPDAVDFHAIKLLAQFEPRRTRGST